MGVVSPAPSASGAGSSFAALSRVSSPRVSLLAVCSGKGRAAARAASAQARLSWRAVVPPEHSRSPGHSGAGGRAEAWLSLPATLLGGGGRGVLEEPGGVGKGGALVPF